jgi:HTH-type transcriptional regulator / antitoxin HigA
MTALAIHPEYLLANFRAPSVIRSEAQNEHYIEVLEQLERKKKLTREERKLAELLTLLISEYEEKHYQLKTTSPIQVLQELMRANGLRQKDLAEEFGTESIVSEVLSGKRELNKEHIKRLSERFRISPAVFFD